MTTGLEPLLRFAAQLLALAQPPPVEGHAPDRAWWRPPGAPPVDPVRAEVDLASQYVATADGTRLAVDVYRPRGPQGGDRLPTMLVQTRYHRRGRWKPWALPLREILDPRLAQARRLAAAGYATVVVDVRGSGASFGRRDLELGQQEVEDARAICDWIVAQPWSDGHIAATGVSYEGSTAENLLRLCHPAVRAVVPRYCLFDAYRDTWAPGGVHLRDFQGVWSSMIDALDRDAVAQRFGHVGVGAVAIQVATTDGVAPVDGDDDLALLTEALRDHAGNHRLADSTRDLAHRDDVHPDGWTWDDLSPSHHVDAASASGAAVLSWSGWFDGGNTLAAVHRWRALAAGDHATPHRLLLGPWDHGNGQLPDPTTPHGVPAFDAVGEIVRFCDHHLRGPGGPLPGDPPVRWYTMGEGWKGADTWPPPGYPHVAWHLSDGGRLDRTPPPVDAVDEHQVDMHATTGCGTRWHSLANTLGARIGYPDRAEQDRRLLTYDSDPLTHDVEVTGHPMVHLHMAMDTQDGAVFAYLEEVTPEDTVRYITEGLLRVSARALMPDPPAWAGVAPMHSLRRTDAAAVRPGQVMELVIGLLPVSYLLRAGSRIRLALSGADDDSFERVPASGPGPTWQVHRGPARLSRLLLPQQARPLPAGP